MNRLGKPTRQTLFLLIVLICTGLSAAGCHCKDDSSAAWTRIERYFEPPAHYRNRYGDYRSPLVFHNGDTVRNAADWQRRRAEIREQWMGLLGEWPPISTGQQFEIIDTLVRENFRQYRVRFDWLPGLRTEGYLLVPDAEGRKPAVITVFYEPETAVGNGSPNRDFALQLVRRGFVTLSLGTTETTRDRTYSLYYPNIQNATMQPLSALACAAANAWETLAMFEEVDSTRIGIMGHSYGGKWAMFASCLNDKFACAAWSDPGIVFDETKAGYINYWEPWYLGYYPPPWENTWREDGYAVSQGAYPKLRAEGHDLHELHALMAPRPFLVSGGYSDGPERWIPLNHTIAVNRLLGCENRVAMTNRLAHAPSRDSNETICDFFEWSLHPDSRK